MRINNARNWHPSALSHEPATKTTNRKVQTQAALTLCLKFHIQLIHSLVVAISFLTRHSCMTLHSNLQFLIELTIASNSDFHQDQIHTHHLSIWSENTLNGIHPALQIDRTTMPGLCLSIQAYIYPVICVHAKRCNSVWRVSRHRFSSGWGEVHTPIPEEKRWRQTFHMLLHLWRGHK